MLIVLVSMLTSCLYYEEQEPVSEINVSEEGESVVITLNESEEGVIIVLDNDTTINMSKKKLEEKEEIEEGQAEEQTPTRVSEVEFYFLLKGKSYFRDILKENQIKTYNMSGYIVSIEPIIITSDSVKFQINNFTTKALEEKDSDSTKEFEIIVKDIYYRP